MRKVFMAVFALLISVAFVSAVFAQVKPEAKPAGAPEKAPAAEKPVGVPDKPEGTPAPDKPKPKPKPKGVFMGAVTSVNASTKMVTVKSNSGTPGEIGDVTFDLTNAKLKGYKGIGDIKAGDKVSVKYTKDGVTVDKMGGPKAVKR
jgi:hypothetical protein